MAFMDEKEFKKHISSKKFNNIYIIFGNDKYLVKFYTKELLEAVAGKEPSEFSFHSFSEDVQIQSVADAIGVIPFMSEYNCVYISDLDVNRLTNDEFDSLLEVLSGVPDTTVVIFSFINDRPKPKVENKEGKEKNKEKFMPLCAFVNKLGMGAVAEINMRSATSLEHQLVKWADKLGKKLSMPIAAKIIYYCGTDLSTLRLELNKVCSFAGDNEEITLEMVETTVVKNLEARVFDMVDNVIYGNVDKAYTGLYQIFAQHEEPNVILYLLAQAYIDLYRERVTYESGGKVSETAEFFNYRNRAWVLTKAHKKSEKLSTNALRESLRAIADLSEKFNSVTINKEAGVEKLVADLILIAIKERPYAKN